MGNRKHRWGQSGDDRVTIVGAGSRVLGVGLADDVLVYLVPLVLIVTSAEGEKGGGEGRV